QATDFDDFKQRLETKGVEVARVTNKTITYLHIEENKKVRGNKLGEDYEKGEIVNAINKQKQSQEQQVRKPNVDFAEFERRKKEINENMIKQNKLLAERMNMLEENNENRNKKIDQLIKQTENVAEAYHSSLKNNNQKFVSILNQKLNEIDKDNVLETITKETEQAHQKNKQMLEETQELQNKMQKQFRWFKVGIIALFVAFLAFAILSTLLSGVFDVLGVTPLYDNLNHTIKHSETIWGNLWYIAYLIPYALL